MNEKKFAKVGAFEGNLKWHHCIRRRNELYSTVMPPGNKTTLSS